MAQNLEGTKTLVNLAKAFAGECQAGARYQFTGKKAQKEGYEQIMQLFKTLAKNEMAHALIYYNFITQNCTIKIDDIKINTGYPFKCGTLAEELIYSAENEQSEAENIYPAYAATAKKEGFADIAAAFEMIAQIETLHMQKLQQVGEMLKDGSLYKKPQPQNWVCAECGHEDTLKSAWKICPVCKYAQGYVQLPLQ